MAGIQSTPVRNIPRGRLQQMSSFDLDSRMGSSGKIPQTPLADSSFMYHGNYEMMNDPTHDHIIDSDSSDQQHLHSIRNSSKHTIHALQSAPNQESQEPPTPQPGNYNSGSDNTGNGDGNTGNGDGNTGCNIATSNHKISNTGIITITPRKAVYQIIDENGNKKEQTLEIKTEEDLHKLPSKYLTAQERVYLKTARWTPSQVLMSHLEDKLNTTIGRQWWKKYISAAFWSNIATPINLAITLFTTLTTGQAATDSLLSQDVFIRISIVSLILSTLNTFFRPHQQTNLNTEAMNKWRQIGSNFEEIYYSECFNDLDYERRIKGYQQIQKDVHNEHIAQETASQNYLTDLIYFIISHGCLNKSDWITEKHKTNIGNGNGNGTGSGTGNGKRGTGTSNNDKKIKKRDVAIQIEPSDGNADSNTGTGNTGTGNTGTGKDNTGKEPVRETVLDMPPDNETIAKKDEIANYKKIIEELQEKYQSLEKLVKEMEAGMEEGMDNMPDIYLDNARMKMQHAK